MISDPFRDLSPDEQSWHCQYLYGRESKSSREDRAVSAKSVRATVFGQLGNKQERGTYPWDELKIQLP